MPSGAFFAYSGVPHGVGVLLFFGDFSSGVFVVYPGVPIRYWNTNVSG